MRAKQRDDGSEDPDFVLNKPQFRNPGILVTGNNFGAGSSREAAVWGMLANNIRVIVARSFADIYRENCLQNGLLPVDAGAGRRGGVRAARDRGERRGAVHRRSRDPDHQRPRRAATSSSTSRPSDRTRLLEGLDDIGMTLKHTDDIKALEKRMAAAQPWLQTAETADYDIDVVMPGLVPGIHVLGAAKSKTWMPDYAAMTRREWRKHP